jgi:DNA-binding FadR family transcriptional regulator
VVPVLRQAIADQEAAVGDSEATLEATDRFHGALVDLCGNETLRQVVGSLERMWATHQSSVYDTRDEVPPVSVWKAAIQAHTRIANAVERGDPKVQTLVRDHLVAAQSYVADVDATKKITASIVGDAGG